VVEAMISLPGYSDLVGAYWKGSLTSKASTSDTIQTNKIINHRGVDRIQNGKMVETCRVVDSFHQNIKKEEYN
jgi:hypothetical protein